MNVATTTVTYEHSRDDDVKIKASGAKAKVLALHENEDGAHEFLCRYTNKTDTVCDKWLKPNAIEDWTE